MKRKFLSLVLALSLLMSLVIVPASAAETAGPALELSTVSFLQKPVKDQDENIIYRITEDGAAFEKNIGETVALKLALKNGGSDAYFMASQLNILYDSTSLEPYKFSGKYGPLIRYGNLSGKENAEQSGKVSLAWTKGDYDVVIPANGELVLGYILFKVKPTAYRSADFSIWAGDDSTPELAAKTKPQITYKASSTEHGSGKPFSIDFTQSKCTLNIPDGALTSVGTAAIDHDAVTVDGQDVKLTVGGTTVVGGKLNATATANDLDATSKVAWSVDYSAATGATADDVKIVENTGVITVSPKAHEGTYTIKATGDGINTNADTNKTVTLTVTRATPVVATTIEVMQDGAALTVNQTAGTASAKATILPSGNNTTAFTAVVKNQYDEVIPNDAKWTLDAGTTKVTMADGVLTIPGKDTQANNGKTVALTVSSKTTSSKAIVITVTLSDKPLHTIDGTLSDQTITYGDAIAAQTIKSTEEPTAEVTYTSDHPEIVDVNAAGALTVKKAGSATITAAIAETDNHAATKGTYTVTVNTKELTIDGLTAESRAYDGTDVIALTGGTLTGVVKDGEVNCVIPATGTVASADAAQEAKAVTAVTPELTGANKDSYTLKAIGGLTATISPFELNNSNTTVKLDNASLEVKNEDQTVTVTSAQTELKAGAEKTVLTASDYDVTGNTAKNVGKYTVTITGKGNYSGTATADWEITKVKATVNAAPTAITGLVYNGTAQALVTAGTGTNGEMQYALAEDGPYSTTIPTKTDAGKYDVWYKVVATDTLNYADSLPVELAQIEIAAADPTAADFDFTAPAALGYDNTAKVATVTAKSTVKGMGKYTVTYDKSGAVDKAVDAGTYTVKINVEAGTNYKAATVTDASWTFTIAALDVKDVVPTITGIAKVGEQLVAKLNVPGYDAKSFTWDWFSTTVGETPVTTQIYTLASDACILAPDVIGTTITAKATAKADTNYTGTTVISVPTAAVPKMAMAGAVAISETDHAGNAGKIEATDVLTADLSAILPEAARTGGKLEWFVNGAATAAAVGEQYTVQAGDTSIKVVFTPDAAKFTGTASASVEVGKIVLPGTLSITGTPEVGQVLTAGGITTAVLDTDYTLQWFRNGVAIANATAETYKITADDLGKTITVKAAAKGDTYTGEQISAGLAIAAVKPDAPVLTATAGDGQVSLSWTTAGNGGTPITGYTLTCTPGDVTVNLSADVTSYVMTGLTNGTAYTFTMTATNAKGTSDASAAATATPAAPTPSGGGGSSSGGGSSNPTVDKETTTNPDGSTTVTETKKDGTVIETTKDKEGNKTVTVTKTDKDGNTTSTTEVKNKDGSTSKTTVDKNGKLESEIKVSDKAAKEAAKNDEPVVLPMPEVPVTDNSAKAPTLTVKVGSTKGEVEVVIPMEKSTPGTVAILVHADGTREVLPKSKTDEKGLNVTIENGSTIEILDNSKSFDDTESVLSWAGDAIDFVSSHGLFGGTGEGIFEPNTAMNRGMLATVLHRLESKPTTDAENIFNDVDPDEWYGDAIRWAAENGIVNGYGDTFAPTDKVTREQMVTMLWRFAGKPVADIELTFSDAADVSDWAADAMEWAVSVGLINGMDGLLNPAGDATRAQAAAVMMRFVDVLLK